MAKITIDDILASFASTTSINLRFQQIEDALNNSVLWRGGFVSEPNSMSVDLDMDGNNILNANIDITGSVDADSVSITDTGGYYVGNEVESALQEVGISVQDLETNKFDKTGGTLSGDTSIITASASPSFTIRPLGSGGFPTFNFIDPVTGIVVGSFHVSDTAKEPRFQRNNNITGALQTLFSLSNNGNVSVNGAAPTEDNHLTRRDYVVAADALKADLLGPTYIADNNPSDPTMFPLIVGNNSIGLEDVSTDANFKWNALTDTLTTPTVDTINLSINGVAVTKSAAQINQSIYFPDAASPLIANVATRSSKFLGFDGSGELAYLTGGGSSTSAALVSITDIGGFYTGSDVEAALQEVGNNKVDNTGDIMTGPLNNTSGLIYNTAPSALANPNYFLRDDLGVSLGVLFASNLGNRNVILKRYDTDGTTTLTDFSLGDDGNVFINGAAPTSADHLTRKDYVDKKITGKLHAGRIESNGTTHNGTNSWTSTLTQTGEFTLTHNLGHTNYTIVATVANMASLTIPRTTATDDKLANSVSIFVNITTTGAQDNQAVEYTLIEW